MSGSPLELFAITAPGLEGLCQGELRQLGMEATAESGGVAWSGPIEDIYRANLHVRSASRIVARVTRFRARSFIELERHARRIDWSPFLGSEPTVRLRVSSSKSKLYHEGAIEERFGRWIAEAVGARVGVDRPTGGGDEEEDEADTSRTGEPGQLFIIRLHRDLCTVSADTSGALLHRRGYRQAVARAPLRETLAAATILAAQWRGEAELLDPLCGSGTIPIEAALIARGIPPGLANRGAVARGFSFQHWMCFDSEEWNRTLATARAAIRDRCRVRIRGSDRDSGAVEAARDNAARAGVLEDLVLDVRPLSAVEPSTRPGWLITNPPYGVRVGESRPLRDLYAALGNLVRTRLPGWNLCLITADPALERQTRLELVEVASTVNGGIPVRISISGR